MKEEKNTTIVFKDGKLEIPENFKLKEVLASSHINFLFGAGVNGLAFPQLYKFVNTLELLNKKLGTTADEDFEPMLNRLENIEDRDEVTAKFCEEFSKFYKDLDFNDSAIENIKTLMKTIYELTNLTENRQKDMKKVNIFTLNYDEIVEGVLNDLGYFCNIATSDNTVTMPLFDIVPHNLEYGRYMTSFSVAKIHGTAKRGKIEPSKIIYPGNKKYETALASAFFEIIFKMKSELMKMNSILFVIGYSGADEHINRVILDAVKNGLTMIWFKYDNKINKIPEIFLNEKIFVVNQDEEPKDTTINCSELINYVISEVVKDDNRKNN